MGLIINGIGVGGNPEDFTRDDIYNNNFDKIGNSSSNIKIINNFVTNEFCNNLIDKVNNLPLPALSNNTFWDEVIYRDESLKSEIWTLSLNIKSIIEKEYNLSVLPIPSTTVMKWIPGKFLEPHVDDLSIRSPQHHISTITYLNDNYEGGEISFITHNVSIKPKIGDLIIFPGNMNYAHEVKTILSGNRYTIPVWFEYSSS